VAQRLVARGADVNARSRYLGRTSLHIAFERGDDALAGDLVRAGADRTIADERGITLAEVYGPAGEDVRPIEVHYVPSAEEQQLTLALRLAVTNHHAMPGFYYPPLQAGFWASLIDNGLASGAAFDPAASRARVIASFDPRTIGSAGFHDVRQELAIAAVAPGLFRLVARKLFARAMDGTVRDGLRVVALSIRGSQEGTSALDAATLRAWITDERVQLGQCAGDLPFSFRTEQGAPAIAVTPAGDLGDEASGHILAAGTAWLEMAELWPCLAAGPTPFYTLSPDTREERAARYTLFAPGAPRGARDAFPFAHGPAEAALRSAMRALHAKVPLREVVLTLPG
jgi:hypothetical protein